MEISEKIKVMQHFENGGEVEFNPRDSVSTLWIRTSFPNWNWAECNFRIKEEKEKVTIEKWLIKDVDSGEHFIMESSDVDLTLKAFPDGCKVKLIKSYEVDL